MLEPVRPTLKCGPGRTKQAFKDECDVNYIMNRWKRTGEIPKSMINTIKPAYGDYSNADDYLTACNQVIAAEDAFASMPAFLRDRFANQPVNLLRFLADPANQDEAIKLGLAAPPEPEPEPAPIPENPSPIEGGE